MNKDLHNLLGGNLKIYQPINGYRAGLDAMLLSAATPIHPLKNNEQSNKTEVLLSQIQPPKVLDVGCGVGTASLCLQARVSRAQIVGIDIQQQMIELAHENAAINQFSTQFIHGDICKKQAKLPGNQFDHVITNPPYLPVNKSVKPADESRATAFLTDIPLDIWIDFCRRQLKQGGWLTIIYRADRLPELLSALIGFGHTTIIPIWPKPNAPAKRIIIRAQKDRKTAAIMHPGLVLHQADGSYTTEAEGILRHSAALI